MSNSDGAVLPSRRPGAGPAPGLGLHGARCLEAGPGERRGPPGYLVRARRRRLAATQTLGVRVGSRGWPAYARSGLGCWFEGVAEQRWKGSPGANLVWLNDCGRQTGPSGRRHSPSRYRSPPITGAERATVAGVVQAAVVPTGLERSSGGRPDHDRDRTAPARHPDLAAAVPLPCGFAARHRSCDTPLRAGPRGGHKSCWGQCSRRHRRRTLEVPPHTLRRRGPDRGRGRQDGGAEAADWVEGEPGRAM